MRALGVVELERAYEGFEYVVGHAGEIASLDARVDSTLTPARVATSERRRPGTRRGP